MQSVYKYIVTRYSKQLYLFPRKYFLTNYLNERYFGRKNYQKELQSYNKKKLYDFKFKDPGVGDSQEKLLPKHLRKFKNIEEKRKGEEMNMKYKQMVDNLFDPKLEEDLDKTIKKKLDSGMNEMEIIDELSGATSSKEQKAMQEEEEQKLYDKYINDPKTREEFQIDKFNIFGGEEQEQAYTNEINSISKNLDKTLNIEDIEKLEKIERLENAHRKAITKKVKNMPPQLGKQIIQLETEKHVLERKLLETYENYDEFHYQELRNPEIDKYFGGDKDFLDENFNQIIIKEDKVKQLKRQAKQWRDSNEVLQNIKSEANLDAKEGDIVSGMLPSEKELDEILEEPIYGDQRNIQDTLEPTLHEKVLYQLKPLCKILGIDNKRDAKAWYYILRREEKQIVKSKKIAEKIRLRKAEKEYFKKYKLPVLEDIDDNYFEEEKEEEISEYEDPKDKDEVLWDKDSPNPLSKFASQEDEDFYNEDFEFMRHHKRTSNNMHLALHRLLTSPKFMTMLGLEIGHQIVINHLRLNKPCSVINIWWSIPVLLMDLDHRGLIPGLNQSKEPGQEASGYIGGKLCQELGLRYAPDIRFFNDESHLHLTDFAKFVKQDSQSVTDMYDDVNNLQKLSPMELYNIRKAAKTPEEAKAFDDFLRQDNLNKMSKMDGDSQRYMKNLEDFKQQFEGVEHLINKRKQAKADQREKDMEKVIKTMKIKDHDVIKEGDPDISIVRYYTKLEPKVPKKNKKFTIENGKKIRKGRDENGKRIKTKKSRSKLFWDNLFD